MSLFTIGYATKAMPTLLEQLQTYKIGAVADIRSVPYSAAFHEYHKEALQAALTNSGIHYVYLGKELGPRSEDASHYDASGQVQFARLMHSSLFKSGIERLHRGLQRGMNIALLCAEKDPANCHRSLLVGHYLNHYESVVVNHISHTGELESQDDLEQRLITLQGLSEDLLTTAEQLKEIAYARQLQKTSYRKPQAK